MENKERGNFIAGKNRQKSPGSNAPDFTGRISMPGAEHEHPMAIWLAKDKNGQLYLSGRMEALPMTDNVNVQLESMMAMSQPAHDATDVVEAAANLTLKPYEIIAFRNKFKDADDKDSPAEAEQRAKRPDFWGRVNPGDGSPIAAIGVWLDQDRYKNPLLHGSTTYPKEKAPDQALEGQASGQDSLDALLSSGAVVKGAPTKGKSRSTSR